MTLVSWASLSPTNNESAGKRHSSKNSHAGLYFKPLLVQVTLNAIRDKSNNYFSIYNAIKKHRDHKKTIIAITRVIFVAIYNIIKNGELFNPYNYAELKNPKDISSHPSISLNEEFSIDYLLSLGYSINKLKPLCANA